MFTYKSEDKRLRDYDHEEIQINEDLTEQEYKELLKEYADVYQDQK